MNRLSPTCICGHPQRDHWDAPQHSCKLVTCTCAEYQPQQVGFAFAASGFESVHRIE